MDGDPPAHHDRAPVEAPRISQEIAGLLDGTLSVEQFVAAVVHEAAQPLAAIQAMAQALRQNGDAIPAGERDQLLDDIVAQARFLQDFAGWMLEPFAREEVVLDELVTATVEHCRPLVPGHELSVDARGAGGTIACERVRVEASIRNLVLNAADSSDAGSTIVVSSAFDDEFARIAVSDRGRGIPERDWERIFKPYARLEGDRPGTGLGLFVVASSAAHHDGFARVVRSDEGGTCIEFALRRR